MPFRVHPDVLALKGALTIHKTSGHNSRKGKQRNGDLLQAVGVCVRDLEQKLFVDVKDALFLSKRMGVRGGCGVRVVAVAGVDGGLAEFGDVDDDVVAVEGVDDAGGVHLRDPRDAQVTCRMRHRSRTRYANVQMPSLPCLAPGGRDETQTRSRSETSL